MKHSILRTSVTLIISLVFSQQTVFAQELKASDIINVDFGQAGATYDGQGVVSANGGTFWNSTVSQVSNLLASDGVTQTNVSVSIESLSGFTFENPNGVMRDYQYTTVFSPNYVRAIDITGLSPDTRYQVVVFSAGDQIGQSSLIELNDAKAAPSGIVSDQFIENGNFVRMEVVSDSEGAIRGSYRPFDRVGAINGLQIAPDTLPPRVIDADGAASPTVYSPGDEFLVTLTFNEVVNLSEVGAASLDVDFDGQVVTATHLGDSNGKTLTFKGITPEVTTFNVHVPANSLTLFDASLTNNFEEAVELSHAEIDLPNLQVSEQGLSVYPAVPGLEESPHYRFRVRELNGDWQSSFAWLTKVIDSDEATFDFGYYNKAIGGWSHTYTNFEMANNVPIEVEITRLDPVTGEQVAIETAVAHPRRKVQSWRVENGRAYVRLDKPTLFMVDIDGEMDNTPVPKQPNVNENATHTVSVFANSFILDKPDINDPSVLVVQPGVIPPDDGPWDTLYFAPGVHQLFEAPWTNEGDFRLRSNKSYYIPGDAMVHGAMNNGDDSNDGENIRIYGHGTISGERIPHILEQGLEGGESNPDSKRNRPIRISNNAKGSSVEGITIADAANHSLAIVGWANVAEEDYNYVRWAKAITWRANGDGISANGSGFVEDLFMRTQDDGTYVQGFGVSRVVYWADVNGMPLRCSRMLSMNPAPYRLVGDLIVDDIDIIYSRTRFGGGPGRSMIGFPDPTTAFYDNDGSHVLFRNIHVSDKFPTRTLFGWDMGSGSGGNVGPNGVRFENVRAASRNVDGELDPFFGTANAPISNLLFRDVVLAGEHYNEAGDFEINEFVNGLQFEGTESTSMQYMNTSGKGKWYISDDWDFGVEPANNDIVNHSLTSDVITVDATAYAGSLKVSHPDNALIDIAEGGELLISNALELTPAGFGTVAISGGELFIENASASALNVTSQSLRISGGTINWAGDRIEDLKNLAQNQVFDIGEGSDDPSLNTGELIASNGLNQLRATFDANTAYTSAWVYRSPAPEVLTGDINGDGAIDRADFRMLRNAHRSCEGDISYVVAADLDASGCIDFNDIFVWMGIYRSLRR